MARSITSADSVFIWSLSQLALASVEMQGYAVDNSFTFDVVQTAETQLGVDGKTSAGWLPRNYPMSVQFAADSDSLKVIDALVSYQDATLDVVRFNAVLSLPGNKMSYVMSKGVLVEYNPIPDGGKVLQPRTARLVWETIRAVPIA